MGLQDIMSLKDDEFTKKLAYRHGQTYSFLKNGKLKGATQNPYDLVWERRGGKIQIERGNDRETTGHLKEKRDRKCVCV